MTTLYERIKAAITERLDLAHRMQRTAQDNHLSVQEPRLLGHQVPGWCDWPEVETMAATVIRMCERDLKLLEWLTNALVATIADGYNLAVGEPFRDMADAYGVPQDARNQGGEVHR